MKIINCQAFQWQNTALFLCDQSHRVVILSAQSETKINALFDITETLLCL